MRALEIRELHGRAPFVLDDPDSGWIVRDGRVDVFATELVDGQPGGPRHAVCSAGPGELLVGVEPTAALVLIGVGVAPTTVERVSLAELAAERDGPGLVEGWARELTAQLRQVEQPDAVTLVDRRAGAARCGNAGAVRQGHGLGRCRRTHRPWRLGLGLDSDSSGSLGPGNCTHLGHAGDGSRGARVRPGRPGDVRACRARPHLGGHSRRAGRVRASPATAASSRTLSSAPRCTASSPASCVTEGRGYGDVRRGRPARRLPPRRRSGGLRGDPARARRGARGP